MATYNYSFADGTAFKLEGSREPTRPEVEHAYKTALQLKGQSQAASGRGIGESIRKAGEFVESEGAEYLLPKFQEGIVPKTIIKAGTGIVGGLLKGAGAIIEKPAEVATGAIEDVRTTIAGERGETPEQQTESMWGKAADQTEAGKIGANIADFIPKMAASAYLFSVVPAGLVVKSIISEAPFAVSAIREGKISEAVLGGIINVVVDLITSGKAPRVKIAKNVTNELIQQGVERSTAGKIGRELSSNNAVASIRHFNKQVTEGQLQKPKTMTEAVKKFSGKRLPRKIEPLQIPTGKEAVEAVKLHTPVEPTLMAEMVEKSLNPFKAAGRGIREFAEDTRAFMKRLSPETKELAEKIDYVDLEGSRLSGTAIHKVLSKTEDISPKMSNDVLDILDPTFARLEKRRVVVPKEAQKIADIIKKEWHNALTFAQKSGLKEKIGKNFVQITHRDNYIPYWKNFKVSEMLDEEFKRYRSHGDIGINIKKGMNWLIETGQADTETKAIAQIASQFGISDKPLVSKIKKQLMRDGMSSKNAEKTLSQIIDKNLDPFFGSLERPRGSVVLPKDWYIRDVNWLTTQYLNKVYKRSLYAKEFPSAVGKGVTEWVEMNRTAIEEGAKLQGYKNTGEIYQEIREITDMAAGGRGREGVKLFKTLRRMAGIGLIGWNPTSPPANVVRGLYQQILNVRPTDIMYGAVKAAQQSSKNTAFRGGALGLEMQRSLSQALEQGALSEVIIPKGLMKTLWSSWIMNPKEALKGGPFMPFMKWGEAYVRTGAFHASRPYLNDLATKAWGSTSGLRKIDLAVRTVSKKKAIDTLKRTSGITSKDFVNGKLTEEALTRGGTFIANKTQGLTGVIDLPRWAKSEPGQALMTLSKMTYRLSAELTTQAKAGNWKKVATYLGLAVLTERQITKIRSWVYNRNNPNYKPDHETVEAWIQTASDASLAFGQMFDKVAEGRRGKHATVVVPSAIYGAIKASAAGEGEKAITELGRAVPMIRAVRGK